MRTGYETAGCSSGPALLLQFSIGAVYAWSVFAKALQEPRSLRLTKVQASLPFEVTIGMIFVGSYIGGRIQDRKGPAARRPHRRRHLRRRRHPRLASPAAATSSGCSSSATA